MALSQVCLTVPLGFTVPCVLMQLSPVETADCLNYVARLIGTVRVEKTQGGLKNNDVLELLGKMEERYEKRYFEEKECEHKQELLVLRSELACETDKLKMHLESSEKEMASLEKQVRLQTSVETLELRCELTKQQLMRAKVQAVRVVCLLAAACLLPPPRHRRRRSPGAWWRRGHV